MAAMGSSSDDFSSLLIESYELSKLNQTLDIDLTRPYIRPALRYVYPLFIFLHACVSVVGSGGNLAMIFIIVKGRLYRDPTYLYLANLALSDLLKAAVVSPITLANLLIENFIFGSFMCFFLPMMHSFPIHASMLTYIMLAADRYRFIVHPMKSRVPAVLCIIAVWVISVCVVLPYAAYVNYVDLKSMMGLDLGLCMVHHDRHIEEYIRAMFVVFYCLPLAVITFLFVKVSVELKSSETTTVALHIDEITQGGSESTYQTRVTWSTSTDLQPKQEVDATSLTSSSQPHDTGVVRHRRGSDVEADLNMHKEKRTQRYLITMVTLFATCWCPISILILVTHFVFEDESNSGRFDITFLTFTFFGYLSTCINPVLFTSWRMSDRTRNRLRGYFQFSNRRRGSAHSALSRVSEVSRLGNSPKVTSP